MDEECIFCGWAKLGQENLWENELFIARLDSFPVTPGHTIIVPKRHVVDIASLDQKEWIALQLSIKDVIKKIENTDLKKMYEGKISKPVSEQSVWFCRRALEHPRIGTRPDAYNHGVNDGRAAGRTIDHLHWHIIPRFDGDMADPRGGVRYVIPEMGNYKIDRG